MKHQYTEKNKDDFIIKTIGDKIVMYKKIDEIIL